MSSRYQTYIWKKRKFSLPVFLLTLLFSLPDTLAGENLGYIPSLNANVTSLHFYEVGPEDIPYSQREYKVQFPKSSSRSINWELNLGYPAPGRRIDFEIAEIWYRPDGSEHARQNYKTYIESNWTSSAHYWGLGWKEAGNWEVGDYRVDLFIEGQKVASGTFSIYSGHEPVVPLTPPKEKKPINGKDRKSPDDLGEL